VVLSALAREGIVADRPDDLRSITWTRAVRSLVGRGIRVVVLKEER
jgi:hypothetical protein